MLSRINNGQSFAPKQQRETSSYEFVNNHHHRSPLRIFACLSVTNEEVEISKRKNESSQDKLIPSLI